MIKLFFRESILECGYTSEGKTEDEALKIISEHAVNVHGMGAEDIHEGDISTAFLFQIPCKTASTHNDEKPS
jgi:predicted small metal-binding protein